MRTAVIPRTLVKQAMGGLRYRLGAGNRSSEVPDHRLVEIVKEQAPGRALDLGSGTGRNAIYLARYGWDSTAVEISGHAIEIAKDKAQSADVNIRFVRGDVTRLGELGIGVGYTLLLDAGCYHTLLTDTQRDAFAEGVTKVAAPNALLIMVGLTMPRGAAMLPENLIPRFSGWRLLDVQQLCPDEMLEYVHSRGPIRAAIQRGYFKPFRYEFKRALADS